MAKKQRKTPSLAAVSTRRLRAIPMATLINDNDPTVERLLQAGLPAAHDLRTGRVQVVISGGAAGLIGADRVVRLTDAPLDRLHARRRLDETDPDRNRILFEAGDRLRTHHFQAGLSGMASASNYNGAGGGCVREPITMSQERHRREMRRAEAEMDAGDWAVVRAVVLDERPLEEVGRELGYQHASAAAGVALDRLRRGLRVLAQFWGALPPDRPAPIARRVARPVALAA